jgi:glycosyltransferase involved in cell wall biosynthesis
MNLPTQENVAATEPRLPRSFAYLISEYPAVSHTFILREVRRLRAMRSDIRVASINRCARPLNEMTAEEREESAATFYIKPAGVCGALRCHLATILRRPVAYFRGLSFALRLAGPDLRRIIWSIFYFVEAVMLGRWMEAQRLRHVHVHFANPAAQVALIASHVFPIQFSLTVHGPDEFYDTRGQKLREKIAGATFICCISYFAISQLMMLSPRSQWHKFELAPLGVDPEFFTPRLFRSAPDPFEILCVGRLVAAKGQHVLLDALDRLVNKGLAVRLRLVGDGLERASLEQEASRLGLDPHITFEGSVNQDRIRELYRAADAFAMASFAEGVPVVLMEAMATEIPCVATNVGGISELIRDNVEGLLVPPSDGRAMACAVERLIVDSKLRIRLAAAGRARVINNYNLESNVAGLARIFSRRLDASTGILAEAKA